MDNTVPMDIEVSRKRSRVMILAGLGIMALLAVVSWFALTRMQAESRTRPEDLLADFGEVPDVTLTERSGGKVALSDLEGKIWIANFIFTSCGGSCLSMSSKMQDMQQSLRKAGDVRLVSFTVDPENDTPEKLSTYADRYQADEEKWLFLTGGEEQMQELAKSSFHLTVEEGTDPNEPIIHSTRFVLVDQEGHIRGYYNNEDRESHQKLLHDIGVLMRGDGR